MALNLNGLTWEQLAAQAYKNAQGNENVPIMGGRITDGSRFNGAIDTSAGKLSGAQFGYGFAPGFGGTDSGNGPTQLNGVNVPDPADPSHYHYALYRNPDGSVGQVRQKNTSDWAFVGDMAKLAAGAGALYGGIGALGATGGAGGTAAATGEAFAGGAPASSYFPGFSQSAGNYSLGSGMYSAGAADMPLVLGTAGDIGTGLGMSTSGLSGLAETALAGGAGGAAGALTSGASNTAGSSASGSGEASTAMKTSPTSFSDARFAAETGIDPSYVGSGTAVNSFSDYLKTANDFLKSPAGALSTSLISGLMGQNAANKAADAQSAATQAAIAEQRRQADQTRTDLAPWRDRGGAAANRLAVMMGLAGSAADPYYNTGYRTAPSYAANPIYAQRQEALNSGIMPNVLASFTSALNARK